MRAIVPDVEMQDKVILAAVLFLAVCAAMWDAVDGYPLFERVWRSVAAALAGIAVYAGAILVIYVFINGLAHA